jgi:hypothetical protein
VLIEDDTLTGEGIKVRGVDFGSVPADVSPPEVVGNEKEDVGSLAGRSRLEGKEWIEKKEGEAMQERTHG